MKIKPHCSNCGKIYLGNLCLCRQGRRAPKLECECGREAIEVLFDALGEWPLCRRCLDLEADGFAEMPLPDYTRQPEPPEPARPLMPPGVAAAAIGLSRREYEVARLYRLSDQRIAQLLDISPSTVKDAFRRIRKKLGLHSRYELGGLLERGASFETGDGEELRLDVWLLQTEQDSVRGSG